MNSPFYLTPIPFVRNLKKGLYTDNIARSKIQNTFTERTVIDLGCGIEEDAKDVQELCIDFKSGKYIGVDVQAENKAITTISDTAIKIVQSDVLEYLRNADIVNDRKVFIFFGFEPVNPDVKETKEYISEMMNLISHKSRINDIILIGNGTHGINPESYNFLKIETIEFAKFKIIKYVKQT